MISALYQHPQRRGGREEQSVGGRERAKDGRQEEMKTEAGVCVSLCLIWVGGKVGERAWMLEHMQLCF